MEAASLGSWHLTSQAGRLLAEAPGRGRWALLGSCPLSVYPSWQPQKETTGEQPACWALGPFQEVLGADPTGTSL